jgi:glucose/arabinose dehydrogenase
MRTFLTCLSVLALVACSTSEDVSAQATEPVITAATETFLVEEMGIFNEPWAITFLPDGRALVTEKSGTMRLWSPDQPTVEVGGVPEVDYGGQGGLGDVVLHPNFRENGLVYFSYVEAGEDDKRGAVVARGALGVAGDDSASLNDVEVIWRQAPKVTGRGHYGHRIAFSPDGQYLFIASGDRQKMNPAQDMSNNLGAIIRLALDGTAAIGNPFATYGCTCEQIWSYGHRNILGLAFAPDGQLWAMEHGPAGGDELNRIEPGVNYGWPVVSNGEHYDGTDIPDHDTGTRFQGPAISWTPVIAPGGMAFYTGEIFPDWEGDALIAGLRSRSLVRVEFDGSATREAARYAFDAELREVELGPDGAIWILEDGEGGRLLRLTPPE